MYTTIDNINFKVTPTEYKHFLNSSSHCPTSPFFPDDDFVKNHNKTIIHGTEKMIIIFPTFRNGLEPKKRIF